MGGIEALTAESRPERPAKTSEQLMEQVCERENCLQALKRVKSNKGSAGIDGMTVEQLPVYLKEHWPAIRAQLLSGTYQPSPVRRVEIPKPDGGVRKLGIPTVLDRMIQQAVLQVLQGEWDATFSPHSHGFRPGHSAHQAVTEAQQYWGAEAEFTHLKAFANVNRAVPVTGTLHGVSFDTTEPMDTIIQRFSISHGVNLLLANIALRQQFWQSASRGGLGRLMLTFRVGLGGTSPHAETTIEEHANEHYQAGGIVGQVAGAGEVWVWSNVYWLAEYKYTRTRERLDLFSGNVTSLLRSQHIVTGPVVHF
jgi:Reverse transcriptase (RNA-dependent DNA polymerase)